MKYKLVFDKIGSGWTFGATVEIQPEHADAGFGPGQLEGLADKINAALGRHGAVTVVPVEQEPAPAPAPVAAPETDPGAAAAPTIAIVTQGRDGMEWHEMAATPDDALDRIRSGDFDKPGVDFVFAIPGVFGFRDLDGTRAG